MKPAWHYIALCRVGGGYAIFRAFISSWLSCRCGPTSNEISLEALATTTRAAISSSCQPPQLSDLFCRRTTRFQEARAFIYCIQNQTREISSSTHVPRRLLRLLYLFLGPRNEMRWGELRCVPPYFSMVSLRGWGYTSSSSTTPLLTTLRSRSIVHVLLLLHHQMFRGLTLVFGDCKSTTEFRFFSIPGLEFA